MNGEARTERPCVDRTEEVQRLIEIARYKTEFLNNAAHELSTPLTPVGLHMDLLLAGKYGPLTTRQQHVVEGIARNLQKLSATLEGIIDAAHAQKAPVALRRERFDLVDEATQTVLLFSELAQRSGTGLVVEAREPVVVRGDTMSLHRVVATFLDNALKYSGPCSAITVRVLAKEGHGLVIVDDNGPGLTESQQTHVFQPFGRAREDDPRQGLGLNLYVAKHLVEANSGRIWAGRAPGGGARFGFSVPLLEHDGTPLPQADAMRETKDQSPPRHQPIDHPARSWRSGGPGAREVPRSRSAPYHV